MPEMDGHSYTLVSWTGDPRVHVFDGAGYLVGYVVDGQWQYINRRPVTLEESNEMLAEALRKD